MKNDLYRKLVDMYAAEELPSELMEELDAAAFNDPELSHDLATLEKTVKLLRSLPRPEFTEESFQRVLMKLYARGAMPETKSPEPTHLQYRLPMPG